MNLITLKETKCQTHSNQKIFGLCDHPHPAKDPAYIDEEDGKTWIAAVKNESRFDTTFTAVDHCIETIRADGKMDHRWDGILNYNTAVIFVELKEQRGRGNNWVVDAEKQIKASIGYFERNTDSNDYTAKKAYIANNQHPAFKSSQAGRMDKFLADTEYILRIENRIILT